MVAEFVGHSAAETFAIFARQGRVLAFLVDTHAGDKLSGLAKHSFRLFDIVFPQKLSQFSQSFAFAFAETFRH